MLYLPLFWGGIQTTEADCISTASVGSVNHIALCVCPIISAGPIIAVSAIISKINN